MREIHLARRVRTGMMGILGEQLAEEALLQAGFENIKNFNRQRNNYELADLSAERGNDRFFIGVKARNESRTGFAGRNESYNLVLISDALNRSLKTSGKTTQEITELLLSRVHSLAADHRSVAAWITIPMRPREGTYAAYFGLVSQLGWKRCVPMTDRAICTYECLVGWRRDPRITPSLLN